MHALSRLNGFEDLFSDMTRRLLRPESLTGLSADAPGEIRVDVSETDKVCEVRAQVPGARKEDIRVSVDGNFVSITAETHADRSTDCRSSSMAAANSSARPPASAAPGPGHRTRGGSSRSAVRCSVLDVDRLVEIAPLARLLVRSAPQSCRHLVRAQARHQTTVDSISSSPTFSSRISGRHSIAKRLAWSRPPWAKRCRSRR